MPAGEVALFCPLLHTGWEASPSEPCQGRQRLLSEPRAEAYGQGHCSPPQGR